MQVTEERSTAAKTEEVAHTRPSVERWLRWSGLIPLPAFLMLHLGRELWLAQASDVADVVRSGPGVLALLSSALLVWLPLGAHALLGVWRLTSPERHQQPPGDLPRQALLISRATAVVALLFLVYHAGQYPLATLLGEADARDAGLRLLAEISGTSYGVPLRGAAYLLGLAATVTHAGLGVHRALLLEGLLVSSERRKASARLCAFGCAALFCVGAVAVIRVATGSLLR